MRKRFPIWMTSAFLGYLFFLQIFPTLADPIPNISITSATGSAVWGGNIGGGANASLSGPDFTLNFSGFYPPADTYAFPGSGFGGDSGSLPLHEVVGAADIPGGTLTIGGVTNDVVYNGSIEALPLATGIVPSGSASIVLRAVLTSNGFPASSISVTAG